MREADGVIAAVTEVQRGEIGGITDAATLRRNLEMHCLPGSLIDGGNPDYDEFLEERRRLMALKIKVWFEAL